VQQPRNHLAATHMVTRLTKGSCLFSQAYLLSPNQNTQLLPKAPPGDLSHSYTFFPKVFIPWPPANSRQVGGSIARGPGLDPISTASHVSPVLHLQLLSTISRLPTAQLSFPISSPRLHVECQRQESAPQSGYGRPAKIAGGGLSRISRK
jgi:hypothetical protein